MQTKGNIERYIEEAIRQHTERITLDSTTTDDDVRRAIRCTMRKNSGIFWFDYQYQFNETDSTIQFQYLFPADKTREIQNDIDEVIEQDFCLPHVQTLPQAEQISYVYKWLVTYCQYSHISSYNQTLYSVFIHRKSVCTGYAKAAHYLFQLLGIESRIVYGRLNNDCEKGRHCWNIVKADNHYYHFDVCFGDCVLNDVARMTGVQQFHEIDGINYNFLCVSTEEILKSRSIEEADSLPECPASWSREEITQLATIALKSRDGIQGVLLSNRGISANIYLCSKDKKVVLKRFKQDCKDMCLQEYQYMQQTKGCEHVLQCVEQYTNLSEHILAIEQEEPLADLLCSRGYECSLSNSIRMAADIALAWQECKKRGIWYRDIHIGNIYLTDEGVYKLGDMGSCTSTPNSPCTEGNPQFLAPETMHFGIFTEASAIYSISMVMYFMMNGMSPICRADELPLPSPTTCRELPPHEQVKINSFFAKTTAYLSKNRLQKIESFISQLKELENDSISGCFLSDGSDIASTINFENRDEGVPCPNAIEQAASTCPILRPARQSSHLPGVVESASAVTPLIPYRKDVTYTPRSKGSQVPCPNAIEQAASTCPILRPARQSSHLPGVVESASAVTPLIPYRKDVTYTPRCKGSQTSFWKSLFGRKRNQKVYSSIFAPLEARKSSFLHVQVYLHLYEESEEVKHLAREADIQAERRDYIPLSMNLKHGDKVEVELNIYGETRLMSGRSSMIWQGSCTKCSFRYRIPQDIICDELNCVANIFVNGALIGEMSFITHIVGIPSNLHAEIQSRTYSKVFISYAHDDAEKIKYIALAYKAQGIEYFYDRDSLAPGDVYEEKIVDFIDKSDLFILCWSQNAAMSHYVRREKEQAMQRAYPQRSLREATLKICPISIEPRAELPQDMQAIYNFEEI